MTGPSFLLEEEDKDDEAYFVAPEKFFRRQKDSDKRRTTRSQTFTDIAVRSAILFSGFFFLQGHESGKNR